MSAAATVADWREEAVCRGTDPHVWFAADFSTDAPASLVRLCGSCPVRTACLADAVATGDVDYGIRAGLTPQGRRRWASRTGRKVVKGSADCGTTSGHARHRRDGEDPCEPCREAMRAYQADYRRERRAAARAVPA